MAEIGTTLVQLLSFLCWEQQCCHYFNCLLGVSNLQTTKTVWTRQHIICLVLKTHVVLYIVILVQFRTAQTWLVNFVNQPNWSWMQIYRCQARQAFNQVPFESWILKVEVESWSLKVEVWSWRLNLRLSWNQSYKTKTISTKFKLKFILNQSKFN